MNKDSDNISLLYENIVQKQIIMEQAAHMTNMLNPQQQNDFLGLLKGVVQGVTGIDVTNINSIQDLLGKINISDIFNIIASLGKMPANTQSQISGLMNQLGVGGNLNSLLGQTSSQAGSNIFQNLKNVLSNSAYNVGQNVGGGLANSALGSLNSVLGR